MKPMLLYFNNFRLVFLFKPSKQIFAPKYISDIYFIVISFNVGLSIRKILILSICPTLIINARFFDKIFFLKVSIEIKLFITNMGIFNRLKPSQCLYYSSMIGKNLNHLVIFFQYSKYKTIPVFF